MSNDIPDCSNCESRSGSLFCELSHGELQYLGEEKRNNVFKKGGVVFYEGNRSHGLFCIFSGKIKLHKLGEDGREQIVRFATKGDVLGYRSLLGSEPYSTTATAIEDSAVCYIPRDKFLETLDNNRDLSLKAIQLLSRDLRDSEERLISITQKKVIERISEALLILKNKFGYIEDGKTLNIVLTRREIGNIANVSTESTIRTIAELVDHGAISLQGKQISIESERQLVQLSKIFD